MKTEHLHDLWAGPDNSRLTTKQFSFRLPVHIAAKIAALCELYPQKNRTQIVADLLTAALDELEKSLPAELGSEVEDEQQHNEQLIASHEGYEYEPVYYIAGPRAQFRYTANRHYRELENELGNENPVPLFQTLTVTEAQFRKQ